MRFLVGLPAMHWLLATRQRVSRVKDAQLVCVLVRLQLVCYIFLYRFRILPYRIHIISTHVHDCNAQLRADVLMGTYGDISCLRSIIDDDGAAALRDESDACDRLLTTTCPPELQFFLRVYLCHTVTSLRKVSALRVSAPRGCAPHPYRCEVF